MSKTRRKEFIRSVCVAGGCLCGFGAIASVPESGVVTGVAPQEPTDERRVDDAGVDCSDAEECF
jgi:hypothetical protein